MLRVISGNAGGHKLKTVKGSSTRPTSDRVKESLFNIIAGYIPDAEVLDLFAGTGSLGIEALSRGSASAVFVESSPAALSVIRENLESCRLASKAIVMPGDAMDAVRRLSASGRKFDIIFLDPPYSKKLIDEALKVIEKSGIIKDDAIIAAERDVEDVLPQKSGRFTLVRDVKYGDTVLSFYRSEEGGSFTSQKEEGQEK